MMMMMVLLCENFPSMSLLTVFGKLLMASLHAILKHFNQIFHLNARIAVSHPVGVKAVSSIFNAELNQRLNLLYRLFM
jgi:hypothetical protein